MLFHQRLALLYQSSLSLLWREDFNGLSLCLFVYLSVCHCLSIGLFVCLLMPLCLLVHLSVCLCICLFAEDPISSSCLSSLVIDIFDTCFKFSLFWQSVVSLNYCCSCCCCSCWRDWCAGLWSTPSMDFIAVISQCLLMLSAFISSYQLINLTSRRLLAYLQTAVSHITYNHSLTL